MNAVLPIAKPPVAIRFSSMKNYQIENAKRGICPHCTTVTLDEKRVTDGIRFLQCSRCLVVVAL